MVLGTLVLALGISPGDDTDGDGADVPKSFNPLAFVGLVVGAAVGMAGFFALDPLTGVGLSTEAAILVVWVAELGAALLAGYSAFHLYTERSM